MVVVLLQRLEVQKLLKCLISGGGKNCSVLSKSQKFMVGEDAVEVEVAIKVTRNDEIPRKFEVMTFLVIQLTLW